MVKSRRKLASEINVVPYIDVMLVLLIIFMVTAPLLTQGVEVDLPESSAESLAISKEPVTLTIDARGRFSLDIGESRNKPLSDDELVRNVKIVMKRTPDTMILVNGDKKVDYGRVNYALGLLQEAGASRIGFTSEAMRRSASTTEP